MIQRILLPKKNKNKTKTKTKKAKKEKLQTSLNNFVKSPNKTKSKKSNDDLDSQISESGVKSSDNKESSDDEDENENNMFKIPLKERLRKKIINIGESPIPLENLNYGNNQKRDLSDDSLSDLDINMSFFDEKEKVEE